MDNKGMYTLDNMPLCGFHFRVMTYTFGGSFVDGYILGIIEFAIVYASAYMNMNAVWQGLIASSPLIGVFLGSLFLGNLADKIGRQRIYTINFAVILVVSILQFWVETPITLFILRLILGICIGAEYAIGAALVAEFMPIRLRGKGLTIISAAWTIGYVVAAYVGAWMQKFGDECWRWMLASSAIVAAIVLLLRLGMPESPRWLILNGKAEKAKEVVRKCYGENVDLTPIIEEIRSTRTEEKMGFASLFHKKQIKHTIFAAICWGANTLPLYAILSFVPIILSAMGITDENTFYTLVLNGMLLLGAIIILFIVESLPRRQVVIWGTTIATIPLVVLALWAGAPPIIVVVLFTIHIVANAGYGAVAAYIYPAECFPSELRTTGIGFCSSVSRLFGVLGTFGMPIVIESLGIGVALIGIAVILVISLMMTIFWAPETKGISVDDI